MRAQLLGVTLLPAALMAGVGAAGLLVHPGASSAAVNVAPGAPASCSGIQINDVIGDGHHANTDITAAWFTRSAGRLQAVIVTDDGSWKPAHDDADAAGWALLWQAGSELRYVRVTANQAGEQQYDFGTATASGGFQSLGATTGAVSPTGPDGWATIDVPAAWAADGTLLAQPFALSYDGGDAAGPHWVDRAPGGTDPTDTPTGADYISAPCGGAPNSSTPGAVAPLTSIELRAPARVTGARTVTVTGGVRSARSGVPIAITRMSTVGGALRTFTGTTDAAGEFSIPVPIAERSTLRATAAGLGSQTLTVEVKARVTIKIRRTASGAAVITGTVAPALPGRVLWLRRGAVVPTATTRPSSTGRFRFTLAQPRSGRFQALYLPSKGRAMRALSPTGVIR